MGMRVWRTVASVCMIICIAAGCGYGSEDGEVKESTGAPEIVTESSEITQENIAEEVYQKISDINFSIVEYPIDTERYDALADSYRSAFLKAVTNQIP